VKTRKTRTLRHRTSRTLKFPIILRHGIPETIVADRGELVSVVGDELARRFGIRKVHTTAYNPRANGRVEKFHSSLLHALATWTGRRPAEWDSYLGFALWAARVSVAPSTGYTPFELIYGRSAVLPVHWEVPAYHGETLSREELLLMRAEQLAAVGGWREMAEGRQYAQRVLQSDVSGGLPRGLEAGGLVLMRDETVGRVDRKLDDRWMGPYRIHEVLPNGAVRLEDLDGTRFAKTVSGRRLKVSGTGEVEGA
jgi:hypothetical protein